MITTKKQITRDDLSFEEYMEIRKVITNPAQDIKAIKIDKNRYFITSDGEIYKKIKDEYTKMKTHLQCRAKYKYEQFKGTTVHKLVAFAYELIDSYDSDLDIHHIDGDKLNNCIWNLEAVSHTSNTQKRFNYKYYCEKDGVKKGPFYSQRELAKFLGCKTQSHIALVIKGWYGMKKVYGWTITQVKDGE